MDKASRLRFAQYDCSQNLGETVARFIKTLTPPDPFIYAAPKPIVSRLFHYHFGYPQQYSYRLYLLRKAKKHEFLLPRQQGDERMVIGLLDDGDNDFCHEFSGNAGICLCQKLALFLPQYDYDPYGVCRDVFFRAALSQGFGSQRL